MKATKGIVVAVAVSAIATIVGYGCNTFSGAGKDIQKGGRAVENAANDAQNPEARPHMIMASAESGGSISPLGHNNVNFGANRTFTIKANNGYHVDNVMVDGQSVGAVRSHTFENVTEGHTITATFSPNRNR